ncbi:sensor histidine kinase [Pseudonocardia phyllosphaerae]|uniref:sensor histidine kinase n=1 Tax=Pseudonocardia phyllosphaerae TaxID=3390502 RepID=UPI00397C6493
MGRIWAEARRIPVLDAVLAALGLAFTVLVGDQWLQYGSWPYLVNTVLSAGLSAALLVRRRFLLGSAAATAVLLALLALLMWGSPVRIGVSPLLVCAPLTVVALTRYAPGRGWGRLALVVALLGAPFSPAVRLLFYSAPGDGGTWNPWPQFGWVLSAHVLVIAVAYLWALRQRELADRHAAELAELAARVEAREELAAVRERNRIAREVHDVVAHSITAIQVEAATGYAIAETEPDYARTSLRTIRDTGREALAEIRGLVGVLRDGDHGDNRDTGDTGGASREPAASLTGLPGIVARAGGDGRGPGPSLVVDLPDERELARLDAHLDPLTRLAAVRVVQEAVTNAVRHADPAAPVHLSVTTGETGLHIEVRNRASPPGDPTGASAPGGTGHGVLGLAERVGTVGGRFAIGHEADEFVLTAELPVPAGARSGPVTGVTP